MQQDRLLILFGTQTGNSKDVAERIVRDAKRRGIRTRLLAMDAYSVQSLPEEKLVVFVASTTGQGEVPGNMKRFWRFLLRKSLPPDSLADTRYALFGLGDSGYVDYNVVAKKLDRRLASLGAKAVIPRGLGDDQNPLGYEAALDPWLEGFWTAIRLQELLPVTEAPGQQDNPRFKVTLLPGGVTGQGSGCGDSAEAKAAAELSASYTFSSLEAAASGIAEDSCALDGQHLGHTGSGPESPCMARLRSNTRITASDHFQDTRHVVMDLGRGRPSYCPGDILSVMPRQDEAAVTEVLEMMGLDPDSHVRIEVAEEPSKHPGMEVRLGTFVAGALDIDAASPRRYFFEVLQRYAKDELQRERLEHFASPEGREDLSLYNQSEGRTVLEVLQDFSCAKLPLQWLIQVCPRLQPRQFSIACSLAAHPQEAHITLAVVDYRTPYKRRKRGLCSSWLANLNPGAPVGVWVDQGVLSLPQDPATPLVMVGPGTGVAPFRAFLEERELQRDAGQQVGDCYLYLGFRNKDKDYYYRDEWQRMLQKGVLASQGGLVTAFSRDQEKKVYVTHLLTQNAAQLYGLIQQGAHIYVSGSAEKMPQEVAEVFRVQVLQAQGGLTSVAAQKLMRQLELSKRYVVEAWS